MQRCRQRQCRFVQERSKHQRAFFLSMLLLRRPENNVTGVCEIFHEPMICGKMQRHIILFGLRSVGDIYDSDLFRLWRPIEPICRSILVSQICAQWKNSPVQHRHKYNIHVIRAFHLPNGSTIYVVVPVLVKFGFEAIYSWCRYYTFWQWVPVVYYSIAKAVLSHRGLTSLFQFQTVTPGSCWGVTSQPRIV